MEFPVYEEENFGAVTTAKPTAKPTAKRTSKPTSKPIGEKPEGINTMTIVYIIASILLFLLLVGVGIYFMKKNKNVSEAASITEFGKKLAKMVNV